MALRVDAVILWSDRVERVVGFYRSLGVPFELEDHGDGHPHHAADFAGVHFAVFPAATKGRGRRRGESGCVQVSLSVKSLEALEPVLRRLGAPVLIERQEGPWGVRVVIEDPDGRPLQITQGGPS
jgi:hypothetical protein